MASVNMSKDTFLKLITCPITLDIMNEPVQGSDGQTYEKSAIIVALNYNSKSPITGLPMDISSLITNYSIKGMISEYRKNPKMFDSKIVDKNSVITKSNMNENSVNNKFDLNFSINNQYDNTKFLVNIQRKFPKRETSIYPIQDSKDIVLVIDRSGSMGLSTTTDAEDMGFSILDIVKHSVNTIIKSLSERDRISIITYNDKITVLSTFTKMTPEGQSTLLTKVKTIFPDCQTNMYGALIKALELIKERRDTTRNASIYLFTDGLSNLGVPAKGEVCGLLNYVKQEFKADLFCPTICTFGFGSSLNSKNLYEIAKIGGGWYCYIPDATFVGTIFVNSIANTLSTDINNVILDITIDNSQSDSDSWKKYFIENLSSIRVDQTRNLVLDISNFIHKFKDDTKITFILKYTKNGKYYNETKSVTYKEIKKPSISNENIKVELVRNIAISAITQANECMIHYNLIKAKEIIEKALTDINKYVDYNAVEFCYEAMPRVEKTTNNKIKYIITDLNEQVLQAISRQDWFQKWGKHYLPSLLRAHQLQICNNFKDPGVQIYGEELFYLLQEEFNNIFDNTDPPNPSNKNHNSYSQPITRASFTQSYNNNSNPCVTGYCYIKMADENYIMSNWRSYERIQIPPRGYKFVEDLKKGDEIMTRDGEMAKVVCVLKTICSMNGISERAELVELGGVGGLCITPWHPIQWKEGVWEFPANIKQSEIFDNINAVYSLVLDKGHIAMINETPFITLGHNFTDNDVIKHDYFGTDKVINDLKKMPGWNQGLIILQSGCMLTNDSGIVNQLVFNGNSNGNSNVDKVSVYT